MEASDGSPCRDAPSTEDDMVFTLVGFCCLCWFLVVLAVRSFLSRVDFKYAGNSRKLARFNSYPLEELYFQSLWGFTYTVLIPDWSDVKRS